MAVVGGLAATAAIVGGNAIAPSPESDPAEAQRALPRERTALQSASAGATSIEHPSESDPIWKHRRSAEVVAGLFCLADIRGVNAYLWMPRPGRSDPGETILFDCGWPWSGRDLVAGLAGLGCRLDDVLTLAITHADFDHVGHLATFADESRAEIIAHELEAPRLASDRWRALPGAGASLDPMILASGPAYRLWPPRPVQVTRPIQDGAAIGDGWIAVHTPGHTPGHTAFFHPASKVLIAGDALGSERRGHLRLPKRIYAEDWEAALRSVRTLADLQPEVICFGHGREQHQASGLLQALAGSLSAGQSCSKSGEL